MCYQIQMTFIFVFFSDMYRAVLPTYPKEQSRKSKIFSTSLRIELYKNIGYHKKRKHVLVGKVRNIQIRKLIFSMNSWKWEYFIMASSFKYQNAVCWCCIYLYSNRKFIFITKSFGFSLCYIEKRRVRRARGWLVMLCSVVVWCCWEKRIFRSVPHLNLNLNFACPMVTQISRILWSAFITFH